MTPIEAVKEILNLIIFSAWEFIKTLWENNFTKSVIIVIAIIIVVAFIISIVIKKSKRKIIM